MLTGADTIGELKLIRDETIQLLKLGAFELSKWATNCPELLEVSNHENKLITIDDKAADSRILGMQWNQCLDTFQFLCNTESETQVVSKRVILSDHAKLFDPLGLLGPVVVVAKLILQDLWQLSIQWDESVPPDIRTRWVAFRAQLGALNHLKIPRSIKPAAHQSFMQVHGFCDASERAFGACIYIRTQFGDDDYHSELLCSKSRVAPLKAVSLPRLELSAALLLARLIAKVRESLDISNCRTYLWSDSTIALNWITSSSRRWSVFVANRVGEIQRLTDIKQWHHVASPDNPADMLSRGSNPHDLISARAWWNGPAFLKWDEERWPSSSFAHLENDLPEQKRVLVAASTSNPHPCVVSTLLNKYSSLNKTC
ncbi:PREDICTED: uncharacterized protein LOC108774505, partial [Cyphomyrmex costatus]|uniref:uncharacterized protein LOC108774505 n=1 Tax=Cyphomyrmex costatus TaxID=456900 RepID=UPI0008523240